MKREKINKRISKGMLQKSKEKKRKWKEYKESEIRNRYLDGWTKTQLAFHYNFSKENIAKILRKFFKTVDKS